MLFLVGCCGIIEVINQDREEIWMATQATSCDTSLGTTAEFDTGAG